MLPYRSQSFGQVSLDQTSAEDPDRNQTLAKIMEHSARLLTGYRRTESNASANTQIQQVECYSSILVCRQMAVQPHNIGIKGKDGVRPINP